jgi:hypothetical protein
VSPRLPEYRYKGQPLTPAIFKELVIELFQGKLTERHVIVEEALRIHLARGGTNSRAQDLPRSVKKALSELREAGLAENPSFGYWRVISKDPTPPEAVHALEETRPADYVQSQGDPPVEEPAADIILGVGSGAAYLYYLPTYRILAESNGEKLWPCKVGRTGQDPLTRILSQAATALPEKPHVAIIIHTDQPAVLESTLHGALTLRGRLIEDSPGSEWFLTNPDEVLALAQSLDPRLHR